MKKRKPFGYWNQPAESLAIKHSPEDANGSDGYIRISRNNVIIALHIWVWKELVGEIPKGHQIDHKNGNRTDCRLTNLRCVPQVINLRNSAKRAHNTSGVTGVDYWKTGNAWRASVFNPVTGKRISTTFSVNKYGDEAFILACEAREIAMENLIAQGAGYSDRHGK